MATFGEFLRAEPNKKGSNQSDFGQQIRVIMTDISKIENGHKKFTFANLDKLTQFLGMDYSEIKNLFIADRLVEEAHKYDCSGAVFSVAESQSKYIRSKNTKQGKIKF